MLPDDFCAFILTHGRPDRVFTLDALAKHGYTGKWFLVVDDEDKTLPQYIERFGEEKVLVFSKDEIAKTIDEATNAPKRGVILYARNACWQLAEQVGCQHFIQLDDDYHRFCFKYDGMLRYGTWSIGDLDRVWGEMFAYFRSTSILTLAMSQEGDHIGGYNASDKADINTKRKAMNSFICSLDRRFEFFGNINEDVNTYALGTLQGKLFLTLLGLALLQMPTQSNAGGMTETYADSGTYLKSFYSVMYAPSCVIVKNIVAGFQRIHHKVDWDLAAPKILREDLRKKRDRPEAVQ